MATTTATKKSSFLVKTNEFQSRDLLFRPPDQMPTVDRDYGLLKITADKSSTPFPRPSNPIDLTTLRARLEEEQRSKIKVEPVEESDPPIYSIHFDSKAQKSHVMHPDQMPSGTPHPNKGTAVNPKLLKKQISAIDWNAEVSHQWANIRRLSKFQSKLTDMEIGRNSVRSLLSLQSARYKNTLPSCLRKSSSTEHDRKCKKVTLITPRGSTTTERKNLLMDQRKSVNGTVINPGPSSHLLSFEERRRLFCEGEFTIAKNGKKMSEQCMSDRVDQLEIVDATFRESQRATDAIESFIRKQGFIKAPAGTLTGNTKLKLNDSVSQTSFISTPSIILTTRNQGNAPNILRTTTNSESAFRLRLEST